MANSANSASNIIAAASETASGLVELATTGEATTGTDTARAVTPAGAKAAIEYFSLDDFIDAYLASNLTGADTWISRGDYRIGIYYAVTNAGWTQQSTTYTVPTGKKLVLLRYRMFAGLISDTTNRKARLRNNTDSTNAIDDTWGTYANGYSNQYLYVESGGSAGAFLSVAAGKNVGIGIYSAASSYRSAGMVVIAREVDA